MQVYIQNFINTVLIPAIKSLALAIIVLIVGLFAIKWGIKKLKVVVYKSKIDSSLKPFVVSLADAALKIFLVISVIGILGVQTSSFVAVLASAGLAIGLAFQGSLSNFAGGVLILTSKPFGVGNYIEANGYAGTVESIKILYTELVTPDNKVIFIPNGNLANSSIVNYSMKETRRVDLKFYVSYNENNSEVISTIKSVIEEQPLVLKDPEPFVRMSEHGERAVVYTVRAWVKSKDYWEVYFNITEEVKRNFDDKDIEIPYPQIDVHMKGVIDRE
jgi:small conductance mechanosensitive channel